MQLRLGLACAALLVATPAEAGLCTLSLPTPGGLALSADGLRLGSEETGVATPGTLTVLSVGSSTLTVDPPVWTQVPAEYQPGAESREVRYTAPLSGGSQAYTAMSSSITVPNLLNAVILTINNRVTNPQGFAAGDYRTRTVVTCS